MPQDIGHHHADSPKWSCGLTCDTFTQIPTQTVTIIASQIFCLFGYLDEKQLLWIYLNSCLQYFSTFSCTIRAICLLISMDMYIPLILPLISILSVSLSFDLCGWFGFLSLWVSFLLGGPYSFLFLRTALSSSSSSGVSSKSRWVRPPPTCTDDVSVTVNEVSKLTLSINSQCHSGLPEIRV